MVGLLMWTWVVVGEWGLETWGMTAVIDDDRYGKLVGLWNLLNRFPIGSTIRKPEVLALVTFPIGLNRDGVSRYAGQPEARRETCLGDRQFEESLLRSEAPELLPLGGP